MSNTLPKTNAWIPFAAAIGGLVIFALIVLVAYLPQRPSSVQLGSFTPEERATKLKELRSKEQKQATSYAWVDQQKGVVQLPIDRAVELTIKELNAKK